MKSIRVSIMMILAVALAACSGVPLKPADITEYDKAVGDLSTSDNFAFHLDGHDYYFAPASLQDGGYSCYQYVGYKDGKFSYRFSYADTKALREIYAAKIGIVEKMRQALAKIETFKMADSLCTAGKGSKIRSRWSEGFEGTLTFLVYSPAVALSLVFAPGYWFGAVKDMMLDKELKKIRLGMNSDIVPHPTTSESQKWQDGDYEVHAVQTKIEKDTHRKLVFVFKQNRLIAYVWGH